MNLDLGILLICFGLVVSFLVFFNFKKKKRMSLIWGGFNMFALSLIFITFGIYLIINSN